MPACLCRAGQRTSKVVEATRHHDLVDKRAIFSDHQVPPFFGISSYTICVRILTATKKHQDRELGNSKNVNITRMGKREGNSARRRSLNRRNFASNINGGMVAAETNAPPLRVAIAVAHHQNAPLSAMENE
jgi:hypothetical protein